MKNVNLQVWRLRSAGWLGFTLYRGPVSTSRVMRLHKAESKGPTCFCEPFYNRTLSHLHASHHLGLITPYRPRVLLPFHEQHLNFQHDTFKPQPTHLKAPLLPSFSWNPQVNQLQASSQSGPQCMAKSEVPFVGSVNLWFSNQRAICCAFPESSQWPLTTGFLLKLLQVTRLCLSNLKLDLESPVGLVKLLVAWCWAYLVLRWVWCCRVTGNSLSCKVNGNLANEVPK